MIRRPVLFLLVAGLLIVFTAVGALAQHDRGANSLFEREQGGLTAGPPSQLVLDNFEVLGHVGLGGGSAHGDVWFFDHGGDVGKHAYVGSWRGPRCGEGVKVVDVNDPTRPKRVAVAGSRPNVSFEDMVVLRFPDGRDIMGTGVQSCRAGHPGGLELFDVSDPSNPVHLSFLQMPAGGVHELDMVIRSDGQVLALLAVPFGEFVGEGEFWIVDVTEPEEPEVLSSWGLIDDGQVPRPGSTEPFTSTFQGLGYFAFSFAHSARAFDDGTTAYVAYFDAGVLKFDISDPTNPMLVGRTTYDRLVDGDAHSMTLLELNGTRYIFQNDEDFDPFPLIGVETDAPGAEDEYAAIQMPWMPTLIADEETVTGTVHDAGDGCSAADYEGAAGMVVLVDTVDPFVAVPPCPIGDQLLFALDAGADAVVLNLIGPDNAWPFAPDGRTLRTLQREAVDLRVVMVSSIDDNDVASAIRAAGEATIDLTGVHPGWGFLRIYEETNGNGIAEFEEVGRFPDPDRGATLPHVLEADTPPGTWSIHNTEVLGDRAYSSWYSHGIVALDITEPTEPVMVGQFVPATSRRFSGALGVGPAEVWGVAIDPETGIIYASDMRTGLWIVRPTGPAAPTG